MLYLPFLLIVLAFTPVIYTNYGCLFLYYSFGCILYIFMIFLYLMLILMWPITYSMLINCRYSHLTLIIYVDFLYKRTSRVVIAISLVFEIFMLLYFYILTILLYIVQCTWKILFTLIIVFMIDLLWFYRDIYIFHFNRN